MQMQMQYYMPKYECKATKTKRKRGFKTPKNTRYQLPQTYFLLVLKQELRDRKERGLKVGIHSHKISNEGFNSKYSSNLLESIIILFRTSPYSS